jgi:hypothetical protein
MSDHTLQRLIAHHIAISFPSSPAVLQSFLEATGLPAPDLANPPDPDLRTLVFESTKSAKTLDDVHADTGPERAEKQADIAGIRLAAGTKLEKVVRSVDGISAVNLLSTVVARLPSRNSDTTSAS